MIMCTVSVHIFKNVFEGMQPALVAEAECTINFVCVYINIIFIIHL